MRKKEAAAKIVELVQEIQLRLDAVSQIYHDHGGDEEYASYLSTSELITGYLHQDVMHPILVDHPDLAPGNWTKSDGGQWWRQSGN